MDDETTSWRIAGTIEELNRVSEGNVARKEQDCSFCFQRIDQRALVCPWCTNVQPKKYSKLLGGAAFVVFVCVAVVGLSVVNQQYAVESKGGDKSSLELMAATFVGGPSKADIKCELIAYSETLGKSRQRSTTEF